MRRWGWIVALLLSLGMNVGILTTLAMRPKAPEAVSGGVGGNLDQLARRLGLQQPDRERFVRLQERFLGEIRRNHRQLRRSQKALWAELGARYPNEARIREQVTEIGRLQQERHELLARVVLDSRELLDRRQLRLYRTFLLRLHRRLQPVEARPG